jgi:hypothetical protein
VYDTGISIDKAVILPFPIFTYPAKTPFALGNKALPGAKVTLDRPSIQGSKIGGEFCSNETFFGHLCPRGFWKTEKVNSAKSTQTCPPELQ